ncbi:MAG: hypothetical protein IJR12_05335 [Bacteroidales bacterium]|nr:hypothetical protein [Bacteroidales bacterium]
MLEKIASILTIAGFGITVWQLISFKKKLDKNSEEVKDAQRQLIHLAKVSDAIRLTELIQEHLLACELRLALYRAQELNKVLNDINDEKVVRNNVRDNYNIVRISFSERLTSLQQAVAEKESYDPQHMLKALQNISDNLQIVQKHLKK